VGGTVNRETGFCPKEGDKSKGDPGREPAPGEEGMCMAGLLATGETTITPLMLSGCTGTGCGRLSIGDRNALAAYRESAAEQNEKEN
jgi:hypothetical protein